MPDSTPAPSPRRVEMRIDDLAHAAGVASTTVRLYQTKGLLPGPRVVGRTGFYDGHHLTRLRLIQRLQSEGFSLAGIARVLETWQEGRDLADLVGAERELDALIGRTGVTLDPAELAGRLPAEALTPEAMTRAVDAGLVEILDDGRIHVPDERFLDLGPPVAELGVPVTAIIDEWAGLVALTDQIAARFVEVFETYLVPPNGLEALDQDELHELARSLGRLRGIAHTTIEVAFDRSLAQRAAERLASIVPAESPPEPGAS